MREKVLRTEVSDYVPQVYSGTNTSGWMPFGENILVLVDKAADTAGEKGLIYVPKDQQDRNSLGAETGVLVAVGESAFLKVPSEDRPKPGEHVMFARYSGRVIEGEDGRSYRAMTDDCVAVVKRTR